MTTFNTSTKEVSMTQSTLNTMRNTLTTTARTSPDYIMLLQAIENLEYSMHRARIVPTPTPTHVPTTQEALMTTPTFSSDLALRKQQYMEYLVHTGDHTAEEAAAMDMPTLRKHIDTYIPRTITVRTALPNGGVTTHYITKKAA